MKTKKRIYSKEFKDNAVKLSYQRDNLKELANELGINVERLYKWRRAYRATIESSSVSGFRNNNTDNEEVKQLKKELKEAQLELEILKKALHIFSKSDGKSINL